LIFLEPLGRRPTLWYKIQYSIMFLGVGSYKTVGFKKKWNRLYAFT
jgi:hypothetical protein